MSLKKITFICYVIFLFFISSYSFGQALSLDDIFKIYSLDSIALKQFFTEKKFTLVNNDEDDWIFDYTFQSNADEKISVLRTFPKDESARPLVRYYHYDQQEYKNFENLIKARGFIRTKYKPVGKKIRTEVSTKYYVHDRLKMEIGLEKYNDGPSRFALTLSLMSE